MINLAKRKWSLVTVCYSSVSALLKHTVNYRHVFYYAMNCTLALIVWPRCDIFGFMTLACYSFEACIAVVRRYIKLFV